MRPVNLTNKSRFLFELSGSATSEHHRRCRRLHQQRSRRQTWRRHCCCCCCYRRRSRHSWPCRVRRLPRSERRQGWRHPRHRIGPNNGFWRRGPRAARHRFASSSAPDESSPRRRQTTSDDGSCGQLRRPRRRRRQRRGHSWCRQSNASAEAGKLYALRCYVYDLRVSLCLRQRQRLRQTGIAAFDSWCRERLPAESSSKRIRSKWCHKWFMHATEIVV